MKKYFLFFIFYCRGQVNFVQNPNFENISSCPNFAGQIAFANFWSTPINGGGGNPETFNACSSPMYVGVPSNLNSYQMPHSGIGYAGIDVASSSQPNTWREYIQNKMIGKLTGGNVYCVKFYASLSNQSRAYIKPLGAYLDSGNVAAPSNGIAAVTPQVYNTGQQLSDTINWMKIEGSFVATGIETYITIGNFFTDAASSMGVLGTPSGWGSYYYIDDVSVIDVATPAHAGNDTTIIPGDSVFIGRPQEVGLNEDCIWYVNNQPIDTVAGMWVKPLSTTTYVLQQNICGVVNYDTVKVHVSGVGVDEFKDESFKFKVFPNPVKNELRIMSDELRVKDASITIYDVLGNKVVQLKNYDASQTIDVHELPRGLYFVQLQNVKEIMNTKFVKE